MQHVVTQAAPVLFKQPLQLLRRVSDCVVLRSEATQPSLGVSDCVVLRSEASQPSLRTTQSLKKFSLIGSGCVALRSALESDCTTLHSEALQPSLGVSDCVVLRSEASQPSLRTTQSLKKSFRSLLRTAQSLGLRSLKQLFFTRANSSSTQAAEEEFIGRSEGCAASERSPINSSPKTNKKEEFAPIRIISLAIVAYNEQETLPKLLEQVCAQDFPHQCIEVVLINSASTDTTRACMERFAASSTPESGRERFAASSTPESGEGNALAFGFANVCVLDNPARSQAAGWNVALQHFTGDALVRVDAHASIPSHFISSIVEVLNEGENVCGGTRPTIIEPGHETPWRHTLHVAEESAFGSSAADYRRNVEARYVDSVFHAAYRREVLNAVGLFNEQLLRTEDNDFHYRVRAAGYRIKLDPRITSCQFIRGSLNGMLKQKFSNGYWVGRTTFVQPKCLEVYHFAPFALVVAALILAGIGVAASWVPFVACACAYALVCCVLACMATAHASAQVRNKTMIALPVVFASIHFSYGIGTLSGLVAGIFGGKRASTKKDKK